VTLGPFIRMSRRAGNRQTRLYRSVIGRLTDILQGIKPIKSMAREDLIAPLLEKGTRRIEKVMRKEVVATEAVVALSDPLVAGLVVGGIFVLRFVLEIDPARVALLAFLALRTLNTVNRVQRRYQKLAISESAHLALRRTILEAERRSEDVSAGRAPRLDREIEIRNVGFGYGEVRVFEDLCLRIPARQITALVGPSGAGKTTIVDLVTGLMQPETGAVLLDGTPLRELDLTAWRKRIGYVPQEMFLLHESVATNVSLDDPEVTREEIERALRAAHAWDFVTRLPDGVDTVVGERGSALSGGQRQRIAIARALLKSPWLLILDEATTALDPESEKEVLRAIVELREQMTVLAVSHQPALLAVSDRAYRVAEGHAREESLGSVPPTSVARA
jgi:ATP-binding cassette subfamily C protein